MKKKLLPLLAALMPMLASAEPAVIRTFEAKVFAAASDASPVIGTLPENMQVSVSEEVFNGYRKVRLAGDKVGYVAESSLSLGRFPSPPPPATVMVPVPGGYVPGPANDVITTKVGKTYQGAIQQVGDGWVEIATEDGFRRVAKSDIVSVTQVPARYVDPAVSWVLSFLIPGVGQMYNGDYGIGALLLAANLTGWSLYWVGLTNYTTVTCSTPYSCKTGDKTLAYVGLGVAGVSWLVAMVQAPIGASAKNALLVNRPPPPISLDIAPVKGGAVGSVALRF